MVNITIVGTGDLAYALAHLFRINNSSSSGNFLEVTKASIRESGSTFHETGVPLSPLDDALSHADVVILAIPARTLKQFVPNYIMSLKDKILVDCTNSSRKGEDLNTLVKNSNIKWVKAFNDVRAVEILAKKSNAKTKPVTKMCSPSKGVVEFMRKLSEQCFGLDSKVVPYELYEDIAESENTIGKEWVHSIYIMLVVFALTETYATMRYNVFKGYEWYHFPIQVTNKAVCWSALTGFALTQIPGVIARLLKVIQRKNLGVISPTLKWALGLRKQLGLVSLWFLALHILMSMLLMNPAYYGQFFVDPSAPMSKMNAIGESSMLFASIGTMFYAILGLGSLPAAGASMNNKQWQLIYGPLTWAALLFGTCHVIITGCQDWVNVDSWPGGMPPITMTAVLIPMLAMVLKIVEVTATFINGLVRRTRPKSSSDLQYIRTLIQAGAMQTEGNDSDENSGSTKSTISYNPKTGNFECQLQHGDKRV